MMLLSYIYVLCCTDLYVPVWFHFLFWIVFVLKIIFTICENEK